MTETDPDADSEQGARDFRTTHWSVVLSAGQRETPEGAAALETLCRGYWMPLYFYVRRHGYDEHEAKDLTQEFSQGSSRKIISERWNDSADASVISCKRR